MYFVYTHVLNSCNVRARLELPKHCKPMQRIKMMLIDARVQGWKGCPQLFCSPNELTVNQLGAVRRGHPIPFRAGCLFVRVAICTLCFDDMRQAARHGFSEFGMYCTTASSLGSLYMSRFVRHRESRISMVTKCTRQTHLGIFKMNRSFTWGSGLELLQEH